MRVQYVASACTVVEHRGVRVLTDPWLTPSCYYGSWWHNPPLALAPEDFHGVDWIYLSHIHQDHADLETLKRLRKGTPVLMAPYADGVLRKMVEGRGFPVHVLRDGERVPLGADLTIEIMPADLCDPQVCGQWIGCPLPAAAKGMSYQVDSLAIFRGGGRTVVNLNDCPLPLMVPALERIRRAGPVDLVLKTYASAGPYPQCFAQLSEAEMLAEAARKVRQFVDWAHEVVDRLGARRWLPFAGQYTLGGRLARLNRFRGVPELEELPDHPAMVRLNRMQWWDVDRDQVSGPYVPEDREAKKAHEALILSQQPLAYDTSAAPDPAALDDLVARAQAEWHTRLAAQGHRPGSRIQVRAGEREWEVQPAGDKGWIRIEVDPRLLVWLLKRKAHWNAAEVGSHLTYWREPNIYDRPAYWSMSHFHL